MTDAAISKDEFHKERSRFLDAFAMLEEAVAQCKKPTEPSIAKELKALQARRNDLVHARFRFANIDGKLQAVVVNVQNAAELACPARLLKLADFDSLSKEANKLKQRISA